jgi:hypothetical protein
MIYDWSTTPSSNTSIGGNNIAENCAPSGINNAIRSVMAEMAQFLDDIGGANDTTGSSNSYALTTAATHAAYTDGMRLSFRANHANTSSVTINVDSLGAKTIKKVTTGGAAADLVSGDIQSGGVYDISYDSANGYFVLYGNYLSVGASGSAQPYDAGLTSIAGLTTAANKMIYTTASDTYAVTDLSSFGRSLIDDADASAARTTLGVAIGSDVQAYSSNLATYVANPLTSGELQTLQNLNSNAITSTQFGYVAGMDQGVSTTTNVEFAGLSLTDNAVGDANTVTLNNVNASATGNVIRGDKGITISADYDNNSSGTNSFISLKVDDIEYLLINAGGGITMSSLPTSNPGGSGRLWNNSGVVNIT